MKNTFASLSLIGSIILSSGCVTTPQKKPAKTSISQSTETSVKPITTPIETTKPEVSQVHSTVIPAEIDLWEYIRSDFVFADYQNPRITPFIRIYADQQRLNRLSDRGQRYLYFIVSELKKRNMPLELALLPGIESAFQAHAYSPAGASGLWQFMQATGKRYGLETSWWYDGRRDIITSTRAALDYLSWLHKQFDNDWFLALAAYNAGEGRVSRAIKKNKKKNLPTDFWSLDLPRETDNYVPQWLALVKIVAKPQDYQVQLPVIDNSAIFAIADTQGQLDLSLAAKLADIHIDELRAYNPGFKRWATDPDGPHHIALPIDKVDTFTEKLSKIDKDHRVTWQRYKIRSGDVLGKIARKYGTQVSVIRKANHLRNNNIRAGKYLMIPVQKSNYPYAQVAAIPQKSNSTPSRHHYTIRSGDSLWKIANHWKVSVADLKQWNPNINKKIKPGQQIQIKAAANPSNNPLKYKVKKGDSLYVIAKRFNVKIAELRSWNTLNKKYLKPGQQLTLYLDP